MFLSKIQTSGDTLAFKSYQTTGSIPASSNQLTLSSNPGFVNGDNIIVELGGEAGLGLRGTKGVGGTWPALSYVDLTAMNADTSQVENTYAWLQSTGNVYQWASSAWTQIVATSYYIAKAIPKALVATITAVNGLVMTLNVSASVASTGANVYYDNAAIFNALGVQTNHTDPTNKTLIIPAGQFAVSDMLMVQAHHGWTVRGEGSDNSVIFSPKGVPSAYLLIYQCNGNVVRDFHLQGNARNDGFGLAYTGSVTQTLVTQGDAYPRGILFSICGGGNAFDMKITDVFQDAIGTQYSDNIWATGCEAILTDALQCYLQWMFQWSDSIGGGAIDCSVISPYLTAGFEAFRSNGVQFIRPTGINATFSMNSSGRFLIDEFNCTIQDGSQLSETSFSHNNPIVNINSNIQPPSAAIALGGTIRNPVIVQEGFINAGNDRLAHIVVNANNPNVSVTGGYPANAASGGLMQSPDYVSGGLAGGGVGVTSDNAVVSVSGIRVLGSASSAPIGNIRVPSGSTVTNCVADIIVGGTQSNNMTNAEWEAQYGS